MLRILANILLQTVMSSFYHVFRLEYMLMEARVVHLFNHRVTWIESQEFDFYKKHLTSMHVLKFVALIRQCFPLYVIV